MRRWALSLLLLTYPGKMYRDSSQLVFPCHLSMSNVYEPADMEAAKNTSHL